MKCVMCGKEINQAEVRRVYAEGLLESGCCSPQCFTEKFLKKQKAREAGAKEGKLINMEELETLCQVFHKWFRVADGKGHTQMWNAIARVEPEKYAEAMQDSLESIGIKVKGDESE